MNCLLAAATSLEINPFLDQYRDDSLFESVSVDVVITGIGLTASTYNLQRQIMVKKPDLVIQAGIAGCFDKTFSLGEVLCVKQDTIADLGVVEEKKLKTIFDLKLAPPNQFPYKKGWLINPNTSLIKKSKLKPVKGISVNQVTSSGQMIQFYKEIFQPVLESMEGAALHYVCLRENIPFLQIRSISNYAGERDKKKWNLKESIHNLNNGLIRLLDSM